MQRGPTEEVVRGLTQALGRLPLPHARALAGQDGGVRQLVAGRAAVADAGAPAEVGTLHFSVRDRGWRAAQDGCPGGEDIGQTSQTNAMAARPQVPRFNMT